ASPSSVTITQGNPASSTVAVTSINTYTKSVTLSVTNCPSGSTCGFSPNPATPPSNGSVNSTLTITSVAAGSYSLTIQGTDQTITHTTTLSLTVNPPPGDFTLSVPASMTVARKS